MLNIAIVDDLEYDRTMLSQLLNKYSTSHHIELNITCFSSGNEFLEQSSQNKFHIVFLDIYMDGLNGMETAYSLYARDKDCIIVFCTSSLDYAVESYNVQAIHYLIKPITSEKIALVMQRYLSRFPTDNQYIELPVDHQMIRILHKDILYINSFQHKVQVHLKNHVLCISMSFNKLSSSLSKDPRFILCYRGILLNMDYVKQVLEVDFLLDNDEKLPIRLRQSSLIKKSYLDYVYKNHLT